MPKTLKDHSLFGYSKEEWSAFSRGKRWRIRHPEKMKAACRSWYDRNTEYVKTQARKYQLKQEYNLTPEEYDLMLQKQNNGCAICLTQTPTGKWKVFAVDHCHKTNHVRGLLCNECNRGMGLLKDNSTLLRLAADYLDFHDKKTKKEKKTK